MTRRIACLLVLAVLAVGHGHAEEEKKPLPTVVILATGGTIAGAAPSETDPDYKPGTLSVEVLIKAVPEVAKIATVRGEQVANIASQDMTDALWLKLAKRVNTLLDDDEVAGVVITHGTDTMEETGYFLHLVTDSDKPVVLTGAMRAGTSMSADGPLNLYNSVAVAAHEDSFGFGAMLVLNDRIHSARDVTKTNTTHSPAFSSPGAGPIGTVHYGKVSWTRRPARRHSKKSTLRIGAAESLPKVLIAYSHANFGGELIDAAVKAGAKGIVLAGVGNGNTSAAGLDALERAAKKGVAVVRSSRVLTGPILRNLEVDDDGRGFVAADTLNPQKARILLKLALLKTKDPAKIQEMVYRY